MTAIILLFLACAGGKFNPAEVVELPCSPDLDVSYVRAYSDSFWYSDMVLMCPEGAEPPDTGGSAFPLECVGLAGNEFGVAAVSELAGYSIDRTGLEDDDFVAWGNCNGDTPKEDNAPRYLTGLLYWHGDTGGG